MTLTVGSLVSASDGSVPVAAGASETTSDDGSFGPASADAPARFGSTGSTMGSTSTSLDLGLDVADETTTTSAEEATSSTTATSAATTTTAAERESTESEPEAAPRTTQAPPTTAPPATTAPPTTQAPPPEPSSEQYAYDDPRSTQVWLDLAQCEAGGNWAANTGNGYYGGLQFSLGSWEAVGGTGYPHEHSRDHQIEMGRRLQASQGWGAWPHCSEKLGLR